MVVIRTLLTWMWLVFGTGVLGTLILVVAPFDSAGRLWGRFVRAWATGLSWAMGVTRLEVQGAERLDVARGTLVMMNHTSGVDVLALIRARKGPVAFLTKRSLFFVPFFGSS